MFFSKKYYFIPLFLWRKEKRQKKHPPLQTSPIWEAKLKIADTANFQTFQR